MIIVQGFLPRTATTLRTFLEKWKTGGRNRYTCLNGAPRADAIVRRCETKTARPECSDRSNKSAIVHGTIRSPVFESSFLQLRSFFGNEKESGLRRRSGFEGRREWISTIKLWEFTLLEERIEKQKWKEKVLEWNSTNSRRRERKNGEQKR